MLPPYLCGEAVLRLVYSTPVARFLPFTLS